jgi:Holliday junction resolvase RusA-like endonuclease
MEDTATRRIDQWLCEYCRDHGMEHTEHLAFRVLGKPQSFGSKSPWVMKNKDGSFRTRPNGSPLIVTRDSNKAVQPWMASVRAAAAEVHRGPLLAGPLMLCAIFYFRRPKGHFGTGRNANTLKASSPRYHTQKFDLGKLVRAIEDAMSGIVYRDDKQISAYGQIWKEWTTEQERAEIWILALEPQPTPTEVMP